MQIFSLDLFKKKNLLNIVSIFLNVCYNSDMKLSGLGLRFAHLVFFFSFVIGVLRFSIFLWLTLDKLYCYIYSFIYLLYVFVYVHICVHIVTHVRACMWRPKFKAGCLLLITFLCILETTFVTELELTDLGRLA